MPSDIPLGDLRRHIDPGATVGVPPSGIGVGTGTVEADTPGSYELTYTATNELGALSLMTRTVIVADTLPPTLTLLGEDPLLHELGMAFVDPGATATDLCAGVLTNIALVSTVNINVPGTYTNTYSVTDDGGNIGTITRTILVGVPKVACVPYLRQRY